MKKVLKIMLIIILLIVIIIYGGVFLGHKVIFKEKVSNTPTIEAVKNDKYSLGVKPNPPSKINEYINLLAEQVTEYNKIAPELWPNNKLINQSIVVEEITSNKFWLISPEGSVTTLSKDEALNRINSRNPHFGGFEFFDGGIYIAVSEKDLTNYLLFEKYLHLGTYDAFITFIHEGFHFIEQTSWKEMSNISNINREEFLDNIPARAKRELLQRQLLKAVSEPDNEELILDALATYEDYKIKFPEDYKNSIYTDRIEGTAYYFELISCLYSSYTDQIKSEDDLKNALALLATREDIYVDYGLVVEGYHIGGFSSILLDRVEDDWKERLMSDPESTPIEMLYQHFKNKELPEAKQITQAEIDTVNEKIQEQNKGAGPVLLFRFLYEILF